MDNEIKELLTKGVGALQAKGEMAVRYIKSSITIPVEQIFKTLIINLIFGMLIGVSLIYIIYFLCTRILLQIDVQFVYWLPSFSLLILLSSLLMLSYLNYKKSLDAKAEKRQVKENIRDFKNEYQILSTNLKLALDDPFTFITEKFRTFWHAGLKTFSYSQIILSLTTVVVSGILYVKFFGSGDHGLKKAEKTRGERPSPQVEDEEDYSILRPLKGIVLALLTAFFKDYLTEMVGKITEDLRESRDHRTASLEKESLGTLH